MMQRKMDRKERRAIYDFLAYYVRFEKTEMIRKFLRLFVFKRKERDRFHLSLKNKLKKNKEGVPQWEPENIYWIKQKEKVLKRA